ncbi:MAG: hypothetical protein WCH04_15925 [Gammaproteobacteria bacterium]
MTILQPCRQAGGAGFLPAPESCDAMDINDFSMAWRNHEPVVEQP